MSFYRRGEALLAGTRAIVERLLSDGENGATGLSDPDWRKDMSLGTILLIVLILLLIGAIPSWPYSSGWGYGPSGILGVIAIIVIVLLLMGRI
jgi:hypothetical protein